MARFGKTCELTARCLYRGTGKLKATISVEPAAIAISNSPLSPLARPGGDRLRASLH